MYESFQLSKGSHLNIKDFLKNDKNVTSFEFALFGSYATYYLQDKELAQKCKEKSIQLEPDTEDRYFWYGYSLLYFGDYEPAIKTLNTCKKCACEHHF